MKLYLVVVILLVTACAPPPREAQRAQTAILTLRPVATLPLPTPTIIATLTASPVPPIKPTRKPTEAPAPEWLSLVVVMKGKVQRAIDVKLWENMDFKEEAYFICNQLIDTSTGKYHQDAQEILKRFRWGMEFMDKGQLLEVIKILDQYN